MKNFKQLLLVITLLFLAISCKNTAEKKSDSEQIQQTEKQHHNKAEKLQLNNGKLWKANPETTNGINAMLQIMSNFSEKENADAYKTLKLNLEGEFNSIIQKCTMTGEAHENLHVFLIPMNNLFKGLTVSNIETSKENFNKLNIHLKEYKNYFE